LRFSFSIFWMSSCDFCNRAEVRRSRKRTIAPRRTGVEVGPAVSTWAGGAIFSNVNAGMVHPLIVELAHPQAFPRLHCH
jgi:hypothetical protein